MPVLSALLYALYLVLKFCAVLDKTERWRMKIFVRGYGEGWLKGISHE